MSKNKVEMSKEVCCQVLEMPDQAGSESACSSEACSVMPVEVDRTLCPLSRTTGLKVEVVTLKALLNGNALRRLDGKSFRFCPAPECDVVYFNESDGSVFTKSDLTVRVGQKEKEDPVPLCYCFNFTLEDIRKEIMATGETQIPGFITSEVRAGHCACEVRNPQGSCCLGNVSRAEKQLRAELSAPLFAQDPRA